MTTLTEENFVMRGKFCDFENFLVIHKILNFFKKSEIL